MAAAPEYTVVARRYRPQQFADLVGQEAVADALANSLTSGRIAHAYLFTGTRGVGKTSTARILAKALNCVKGPTPTPCDVCDICRGITNGDDLDVIEIDGASNRGIDDVRAIRQTAQTRPVRARFKIFIIDEVHMLSKEAFNALLKTLEEPPGHVKFIFATTDAHRVPPTILSRCLRFDFTNIRPARILEHLKGIVAAEGRQADDDALAVVARRAAGSMRDAQSLLEQLLASTDGPLTLARVQAVLGTAAQEEVLGLAAAILARDVPEVVRLVGRCADEGLQLGELLDQLIDYWRDLMLVRAAGPEVTDLATLASHRDELARQANALSLDTILAGLDILTATKSRLRGSPHTRLLLEMAVIRLARLDDLLPVGQLVQMLQGGAVPATGTSPARAAASRAVELSEAAKKKPDVTEVPAADAVAPGGAPLTAETLPAVWAELLAQVGFIHASKLKSAAPPAILGPTTLALAFPAEYTPSYEYCAEAGRVQRVEQLLRKLTGQGWTVRVEKAAGTGQPGSMAPKLHVVPTVPAVPAAPGAADVPGAPGDRPRRGQTVIAEDPLLQRAVDVLGAQALSIDDGFGTPAPGAAKPPGPAREAQAG
jgi:DNA polymerase-3 subunit gamma/tau